MTININPLPPPEHLTHSKYRPDIDGLRAIAVLSVVVFHAFPQYLKGGFIGVDIFFVISGFLISTIIMGSLERNSFSFIEFYSRRIKRIFPALVLVLITCFMFGKFILLLDEYKQLAKHTAGGAGFVANFIFWNESGYFDNAAETKPLLHLWSLGIEEQFYVVWPLLLWFAWAKRFNLLTITVMIAIVSFALNIGIVHDDMTAAFYSPQTRFWELLVGSILAYMSLHRGSFPSKFKHKLDIWLGQFIYYAQAPLNNKKLLQNVQSLLGAFLIFTGLLVITKERLFPGWWAILPTIGTLLIISAGVHSWFNRVVLSSRVLVWFGLISFPLYLWHWPLLSFARIIESEIPSPKIRIAAVLISITLAWMTYKFIEKPIRFGKFGNIKTIALVAIMFIVGTTGYSTYTQIEEETSNLKKEAMNNCNNIFPNWMATNINPCRIQPRTNNAIAIIGDSHAGHLFSGMSELLAPDKGVAVFPASCAAPYINVSTGLKDIRNIKVRKENYKLINSAYDYIIKDPAIKVVVLAHNPACSFGDALDMTNIADKDSNNVLKEGMNRTFSALIAANKKVIVLFDNPVLTFDPKLCSPRPFRLSQKNDNCSFSRKIHDSDPIYSNYRSLVKNVLINYPQIKTFDISELLCDKENCYVTKDGQLLYHDENHLSNDGSRYVAQHLLNFIGTFE